MLPKGLPLGAPGTEVTIVGSGFFAATKGFTMCATNAARDVDSCSNLVYSYGFSAG